MGAVTTLKMLLLGEDRSASKAVKGLGKETENTGATIGKFAGAAAGALAAVGVAKFAKDSIDKFGQVAGETAKLQRYIGGTAEDASRLRFAAQQSGIGIDDLTGGLGKMSKAMAGGNKAFTDLGVSVKDNNGKMKDVNQVFLETSDKLAKMPAGAKKTADILALFGKTGMNLGPMLNKGADGIRKLEKESDKLGVTMSGKDLAATKANTVAKRQFHAAIEGLQISLGRALYPALTLISSTLATLAPKLGPLLVPMFQMLGQAITTVVNILKGFLPMILAVSKWASDHPALIQFVVGALMGLVAAVKIWGVVTKAITIAQAALNLVLALNPIGLVIIAIIALVAVFILAYKHSETFRNIVTGAFNGVKNVIAAVVNWVRSNWPLLLAILTGPIGIAVLLITKNWGTIKAGVTGVKDWIVSTFNSVVGFVTGLPGRIAGAASGMWHGILDAFRSAINTIINGWNSLRFGFDIPKVHIKGTNVDVGGGHIDIGVPRVPLLANGGDIFRAGAAIVGDNGPELMQMPAGARVTPLNRLGGGTELHVHIDGLVVDPVGTRRAVANLLEQYVGAGGRINGVTG